MKRIIIFVIIGLVFLIIFGIRTLILDIPENETLFSKNQDNSIHHLYEGFSSYDDYSEIIDEPLEDLSRWKEKGIITAWINVKDFSEIDRIDLILEDSEGNTEVLEGIRNLDLPREDNKIKSDDLFPDYYFNCGNQSLNKWEDFMIINGENFLFWEWNQTLSLDMGRITSIKASDELDLKEIVIHDGLCKNKNSLNGDWYSPNGLPQYGVWWINEGKLIMRNVRIEQYPSNGDHVRILSKEETPENFILKTKFRVVNLKPDYISLIPSYFKTLFRNKNNRQNTFVRIAWDFDNEYDPGHDQTLLYISLEYGYFGLQRVYPIERYFKQGYEPNFDDQKAKTRLKLSNNQDYEINIFVEGQSVIAEIYKEYIFGLKKIGEVEYTFERERPKLSFPFSIETTGNVNIELDSVEVRSLK
tara:strand:+ start:5000 stop:6244 length:1245 start_codon:yes stop_codon:yes gene_type:complete